MDARGELLYAGDGKVLHVGKWHQVCAKEMRCGELPSELWQANELRADGEWLRLAGGKQMLLTHWKLPYVEWAMELFRSREREPSLSCEEGIVAEAKAAASRGEQAPICSAGFHDALHRVGNRGACWEANL